MSASQCVTLPQPTASFLAAGFTTVVGRDYATDHRGLLYIHAAMRTCGSCAAAFPTGLVLAVGDLVDVTDAYEPDDVELALGGFPARYAWVFDSVRPLARPIPARGRQGVWSLAGRRPEHVPVPRRIEQLALDVAA